MLLERSVKPVNTAEVGSLRDPLYGPVRGFEQRLGPSQPCMFDESGRSHSDLAAERSREIPLAHAGWSSEGRYVEITRWLFEDSCHQLVEPPLGGQLRFQPRAEL
jgi:hypothetical protein